MSSRYVSVFYVLCLLLAAPLRASAAGDPAIVQLGELRWWLSSGTWLAFERTGEGIVHVRDLETGETESLGLGSLSFQFLSGRRLAFDVDEVSEGRDLNSDGDTADRILHLRDLETGEGGDLEWSPGMELVGYEGGRFIFVRREAGEGRDLNGDGDSRDVFLVVSHPDLSEPSSHELPVDLDDERAHLLIDGRWLVFWARESSEGQDLNDDGDMEDLVTHVHDLDSGETANLGLALSTSAITSPCATHRKWLVFWVEEALQGKDLNGDGHTEDIVLHVHELEQGETANLEIAANVDSWAFHEHYLAFRADEGSQGQDLNGDGDLQDLVVHVFDLDSGGAENLGLATARFGVEYQHEHWLLLRVEEALQGEDLNGDGDIEDLVPVVYDFERGEIRNLELAIDDGPWHQARWWFFSVEESSQGEDLNGDGDTGDVICHVHDVERGETTILESGCPPSSARGSGNWLVFGKGEREEDLNGDGDTGDSVCHVHDLETGRTTNLRLAVDSYGVCFWVNDAYGGSLYSGGPYPSYSAAGDWALLSVSEESQGQDLDGDGRLESWVLHVHNFTTGDTTNLGLDNALRDTACGFENRIPLWGRLVDGNWLVFGVLESAEDLNGDGDTSDWIVHVADLGRISSLPRFVRGDCNDDGNVDISDALCTLNWLFLGGATPGCLAATNTNGDAAVDLSDAVYLLGYLFLGGPAPVLPFPACGPGLLATDGEMGCETPPGSASCAREAAANVE
jgi:hypothetical protein